MIASSNSSPPILTDCATTMPAERDDRHLARAAPDIDDHAAGRLSHGETRADSGGHGLFDQVGGSGPRADRRLFDRPPLDPGDP